MDHLKMQVYYVATDESLTQGAKSVIKTVFRVQFS